MNSERILFPVDYSEQTRATAPFVKALASRLHAELVMLNVLELPPVWYGAGDGGAWLPPFDADQMREEARGRLEGYLEAEFAGVPVERVLGEGDAARQIVCQAKADGVGLIMMPTHGYGPYRSLLLGSVTAKVLHDTERPVWTGVHSKEFLSHAPDRLRRILCAVDRDPKDVPVIRWAAEFGRRLGADVCLIHVIPGDPAIHEFTDRIYREQMFVAAREAMVKVQAEAGTSFDILMRLGDAAQIIHDEAKAEQTDLVIVGRGVLHKALGRLRSTAYAIIRESPCPVISI